MALGLPRLRRAGARASCRSHENVDGFNFDTEIIIQLHEAGFRIAEIPIPTYYGDEICYVDGMKYAKDVTKDVLRYRAHKMGFGTGEKAFAEDAYEHQGRRRPPRTGASSAGWSCARRRGCSTSAAPTASSARASRRSATRWSASTSRSTRACASGSTDFYQADLDHGLARRSSATTSTWSLAADVLEHVRTPERAARRDPASTCAPVGR